jgi:voltage-gated potassium channel
MSRRKHAAFALAEVRHALEYVMDSERLYRLLQPAEPGIGGRVFRVVHHVALATGICIMLADTVDTLRLAWPEALDTGFQVVCGFFFAEYVLRLIAAPGTPEISYSSRSRARLRWASSAGGICDLIGALPGVIDIVFNPSFASLFGFVWVFKLVRYAPGLASLGRVISDSRQALLSVLLGFCIVLLLSASFAYLLERGAQPDVFGSIPAALWWAIVTLTTTGYGDVIPVTPLARVLGGVVMISGIMVFALWAGILATGFAEETRRREFLHTWDLVSNVPFFHDIGASAIADVARLLRPREYPAGAVIMRRGEHGDCMYFIASGEVEIRLGLDPVQLGAWQFFGEIALLTGGPRTATVVATAPSTLLLLDVADFRDLVGRQPDLARIIHEEAERRLVSAAS